jgi:hypothetical protein
MPVRDSCVVVSYTHNMTSTYYQCLATVCLLVVSACGGALNYELRGSELSPGADANIVANVDVQRNLTKIDIKADHLTPADRVLDGGTTYLVWSRRDAGTPWMRLGALELEDEGRTGKATFTVSEVAFDLEISAEATPTVASPSNKTVFQQRVDGQ